MAIEDDVVVVGGGIAGMATALSAAREGAQVRLLSHKESTLRHASGLIDVLGYADGLVADPFEAISGLPEEHPYRTVGEEGIRDGLDLLDSVTDYAGGHTDRNALVPTFGGRIKPTARYPKTSASGLASDDRDSLLVGFETVVDFDAPLAAERLSADVPFDARGVTVAFLGDFRTDARITRLAHALDENERIERTRNGISTSLPARTALAERVKPHLGDAERVGFPAMLGEERPGEVIASLEAELGADVFEVPMGPPSLPGMRLETAFHDALKDEGVRTTSGNPVVDFEGGDELEAVVVERNGAEIPFYGDQFVLATGGLVGKGIDSTRERVSEPIFDCHVPAPEDRYDWSDPEAFGEHSFARFGVETDDELRVLDADGEPEFDNLRAAGGVLGGYDFAAEKSGSGVSLSTGVVAGRIASEQVNVNP
ncbi:anaerobic glycerol-3-phosphate dehydrogenase subunit B [Haladaptatus paucihalophilus DX253]|uniref:Anaerobic glycerol-3-phosphate dehydrogenase subunit B n=1 Tax=Haladaptatus paucihalophilus DX253 TaxID=797209 RepID=E7QYY7_HALPU|nr:glycerol-3-phosphate dehydrogenase subunit GlpB [Haladaptatus paucihalophilus]EFW90403.1 anaerobic glycerol-3-phosphate dehydrogenase subunit B [Haladaptatus paucihalophilus DX253]SHK03535.1 glycerol 3-phosphate dehydrogenase (quinone) subunit B [Haladaptatus paucihalophilus DX253]